MNTNRAVNRTLVALALTLCVGACAPVTTYSDAEAPKRVQLDTSTTQFDLHFASGSAALAATDAARLRGMAVAGRIKPSDRIMVAAGGPPRLAEQRVATVSALLLPYGIVPVATTEPLSAARGLIMVTRTLVTLPPCPNWSKRPNSEFGNQPSSNFGCATETNLGMMVANPTDLASGLPVSAAPGQPAAAAVNRYMNDKVTLPEINTALPIAAQTTNQQGGGNNPSSPTGAGTGSQ
jgi:pilus assembly protein CpaD